MRRVIVSGMRFTTKKIYHELVQLRLFLARNNRVKIHLSPVIAYPHLSKGTNIQRGRLIKVHVPIVILFMKVTLTFNIQGITSRFKVAIQTQNVSQNLPKPEINDFFIAFLTLTPNLIIGVSMVYPGHVLLVIYTTVTKVRGIQQIRQTLCFLTHFASIYPQLFHDGGLNHIETSPLICRAFRELKTQEKFCFSDIFRGFRMKTVA